MGLGSRLVEITEREEALDLERKDDALRRRGNAFAVEEVASVGGENAFGGGVDAYCRKDDALSPAPAPDDAMSLIAG